MFEIESFILNTHVVTNGQKISRHDGHLIIGSGMAIHASKAIDEPVGHASSEEERKAIRAKVLTESKAFDTILRAAVTKKDAKERNEALLKLETLDEFKRAHPTIEVRSVHKILRRDGLTLVLHISTSNHLWLQLQQLEIQKWKSWAWT